ncbi:MAG: LSU ribosomal protein L21p [Parcubacteria group bacterium GW2011_GWC1_38_6]|nr:MAG: LSU ribosomal protein L21p [Parcubacteria group bacterium GW2011_GWC1_38_6]
MLAVIETGGKQYLIVPGQTIKVEKINKKDKSEVVFDKVLLVEKNKKLEVGDPFVKGTTVIGELISQGKHEKKIIFKYRPKTRYKVKRGHRQPFTEIKIKTIEQKA